MIYKWVLLSKTLWFKIALTLAINSGVNLLLLKSVSKPITLKRDSRYSL